MFFLLLAVFVMVAVLGCLPSVHHTKEPNHAHRQLQNNERSESQVTEVLPGSRTRDISPSLLDQEHYSAAIGHVYP